MSNQKQGGLVCVGTGILMGAHITPIAKNYIEAADTVFMSVSTHLMEEWIAEMNTDVRNLQSLYAENLSRNKTYKSMVNLVVEEVRSGRNVCLALYGHPGVFALVAHKAIELLKSDGYFTRMEPGISAEDCLFADLGVDPGKFGCQQFEATQFMIYQRVIDPSAYLILWQIGIAGDLTFSKRNSSTIALNMLVKLLAGNYSHEHEVILYEAKTLPVDSTRIDKVQLKDIPTQAYKDYTTLVIPPSRPMERNAGVENELKQIIW